MIGTWILTGIRWGVIISSAGITALAVCGVVLGVIGFLAWLVRGGDDEEDGKKNDKIRPV